jgi:hypothetical protein
LAISVGSLGEGESKQSEQPESADSQFIWECSETILQFEVGGLAHQTKSACPASQPDPDGQSAT